MRTTLTIFALSLIAGGISAQSTGPTAAELAEMTAIRPVPGKKGLYVIPGFDGATTGGNVAVRVTNHGVVLVDNKFPHSYERILMEVRKVTSLPVRYVLDTHHHDDHAGSNADFMAVAEVISHKNARSNILRNNQPGAPRLVFSEETSVFLGGFEVRAYHFGRGHTNGDAVVLFPDLQAIHTGDLFIWGERSNGTKLSPFFDYANGASALAWPATLDAILELDFDTVIPGHGPVLTRTEVQTFRDRMQILLDRMGDAVERGVSRDDIAAEVDMSDHDWPIRAALLEAVFDEVAAAR